MKRKKQYSKYHVDISSDGKAKRTSIDLKTGNNVIFDSLLEKRYYENIIVPGMQSGTISDYKLQKKYILQPSFKHNGKTIRAIDYVADFWVQYADGTEKVYDTKGGMVDPAAKIKRKMMYYRYPDLDYQWITWSSATGWIEFDEYQKIKKIKKEKTK